MQNNEPQLLNVQQSAAFLGVKVSTIRLWARTHKLKGIKVGSRGDWRFTKEELSKMIQVEGKKFAKIKKFLNEHAEEIQEIAHQSHLVHLGNDNVRKQYIEKYKEDYIEVIREFADNLENLKKGTIVFERLAERIAKKCVEHGLTLEEAVDGTIFLKQAFWQKLDEENLLHVLSVKDFYSFNHIITTYSDIVAAKIAFAYHDYFSTQVANYLKLNEEYEDKNRVIKERFDLAAQAGNIGIYEWDIRTNKIIWTPELEALYGLQPGKFKGDYDAAAKTIHPDDAQGVHKAIQEVAKQKKPLDIEYRIIWPDKSIHWLSAKGKVFYDDKGKPQRMIGIVTDITEIKRLEKQKDEFLGIASHELKTPVTSIKAYGQVLQTLFMRKGDNASAEYLLKMDMQINKLNNLIGDLLDVTKIQAGKIQFNEEYFDFNELVNESVEEIQHSTEKHKIITELAKTRTILGDKERIEQVLINLLSNAIKYSPNAKKIIVKTQLDTTMVTLSVQDFGVGISKDKQDHLFEQFYRVSGPDQNTFPGLGLGLYISNEIIKRQGGRIWVESIKGKGSTFYFSLPISKESLENKNGSDSKKSMSVRLKGRKIGNGTKRQ